MKVLSSHWLYNSFLVFLRGHQEPQENLDLLDLRAEGFVCFCSYVLGLACTQNLHFLSD